MNKHFHNELVSMYFILEIQDFQCFIVFKKTRCFGTKWWRSKTWGGKTFKHRHQPLITTIGHQVTSHQHGKANTQHLHVFIHNIHKPALGKSCFLKVPVLHSAGASMRMCLCVWLKGIEGQIINNRSNKQTNKWLPSREITSPSFEDIWRWCSFPQVEYVRSLEGKNSNKKNEKQNHWFSSWEMKPY